MAHGLHENVATWFANTPLFAATVERFAAMFDNAAAKETYAVNSTFKFITALLIQLNTFARGLGIQGPGPSSPPG